MALLRAPGFDDVSAFDDSDAARIDAWLQKQVALAQYPSLSVAVVRDGKIAYQGTFGFQDLKAHTKATSDTSYHVASVTKVFTTSLAVMLHDRGVVNLDQPVVKYLPKEVSISTKPRIGATITLRQLASHTSGLPRRVPGPVQSVEGRYQLEPKRLYAHLADAELVFDPGTGELYSNLGMGLLGHALECAAGKPFDVLLKETVCDPLGLERTAIQYNDKLRLATGYTSVLPRRPETHSYLKRLAPSGGLVASAGDLAQFLSAQMKPGILSSDMLAQLHAPTKLLDGSAARRGLGWSVRERESIGRILKKNGGRSNCGAWIGFAPDHGVGVAVVTNCGEPSVDEIGYWLLERSVPGVKPSLLDRRPVVAREYAKVAPFTGVRWENGRPSVRVQDRWSPVVSIDGMPIDRIIEFAQKRYGSIARKRFAEDLVEVLSTMGHDPEWEVTLGLKTTAGQVDRLKIRMTEENRKLVRSDQGFN
jgi:CubicO group peptidase (beta-lactamase class C family)